MLPCEDPTFRLAQINSFNISALPASTNNLHSAHYVFYNLCGVKVTYICIISFFLSVGGISQRNTRRVIGISLFMQRPKMDISPIVQFQVKSYYSIVLIELDTGNTKLASAEPAVNIKVNRISCKYFKITIYIYIIIYLSTNFLTSKILR